MQRGSLDELAKASIADQTLLRFEPLVMAQDLATSVELLAAAIEAIADDRHDGTDAERLLASLDASFEALRHIRRNLRREVSN
jgi:hypothetical protein